VDATSIKFWFPIPDADRIWQWGTSPDNALEYAWLIHVPLMNKTYELGYTQFKQPGSLRLQGDLASLLDWGQLNIWESSPDGGGSVVSDAADITAIAKPDGVLIMLTEPRFVRAFLSERPSHVGFLEKRPLLQPKQERVPVRYVFPRT
jgi:hypothetical protein